MHAPPVNGRWRLIKRLGAEGMVTRWQAEDATGAPFEALVLAPDATPAEVAAFSRTHTNLATARPGVVTTQWFGEHDGSLVALREPCTSDEPPTSTDAITNAIPAAIRAVEAAGDATNATLTPRDVLWRDGRVVLAPWGAVSSADAPFAAPEAHLGAPPTGEAGLYGLGAVLYAAATGHAHLPMGVATHRGTPVSPQSWAPSMPASTAAALLALLSQDPAERVDAATHLIAATPAPPRRPTVLAGELKLTTGHDPGGRIVTSAAQTSRNARVDVARPGAIIQLTARRLAALTPAEQSVAAGWAGVPYAHVKEAIAAGAPLVFDTRPHPSDARRHARELQLQSGLPITTTTPPSVFTMLGALALSAAGLPALAVTAFFGLIWAAAATLLPLIVSALLLATWFSRRQAFRRAAAPAPALEMSPVLRAAWTRTASLRREVGLADLPLTVDADLRTALRAAEDRLAAIASVDRLIAEAKRQADPADIRTRLASASRRALNDPSAAPERDALARALDDMKHIEQRQAKINTDVAAVNASLSAIASALPGAPDDGPDRAVTRPATREALPASATPHQESR